MVRRKLDATLTPETSAPRAARSLGRGEIADFAVAVKLRRHIHIGRRRVAAMHQLEQAERVSGTDRLDLDTRGVQQRFEIELRAPAQRARQRIDQEFNCPKRATIRGEMIDDDDVAIRLAYA